eukprot:s1516_g6.t1
MNCFLVKSSDSFLQKISFDHPQCRLQWHDLYRTFSAKPALGKHRFQSMRWDQLGLPTRNPDVQRSKKTSPDAKSCENRRPVHNLALWCLRFSPGFSWALHQVFLLDSASVALSALKRWPVGRAVKAPKRPTRLDPPYLDDPTFVHPDKQNQGEREWLMKHNGGNAKELPGLPDEYEWIKDVAEKNENAWIAVKKRMSKVTFDAIKRATAELQDALYTRQPEMIRQQMEVAKDQNKVGEGPSSKAILQAEDYAKKLEDYAKEQEAQREHEED